MGKMLVQPEKGRRAGESKHTMMKKATSTGVLDWSPSERRKQKE